MVMECGPREISQTAPEQDVAVDVDSIVTRLNQKFALSGGPAEKVPITIFRIPANLCEAYKKQLEPSVVSIGPYHRGGKALQAMEDLKLQYLQTMLSRNQGVLNDCVETLKTMETRTRRCYAESTVLDSNEFVEMMLLDGCFILETVYKWRSSELDSTLKSFFLSNLIQGDLLMVENQIPFFVLEILFELLIPECTEVSFQEFLSQGVNMPLPTGRPIDGEVHHLLHWCYKCFHQSLQEIDRVPSKSFLSYISAKVNVLSSLCSYVKQRKHALPALCCLRPRKQRPHFSSISGYQWVNSDEKAFPFFIPCATELQEAGVKLKRKKDAKHVLDITFRNGTLEIPRFSLFPGTIPFFMNLVAFEQFAILNENDRDISAFAIYLDCIINTAKDVVTLHRLGIIHNYVGSDEEAASMCNQFSIFNSVFNHPHKYSKLFRDINLYCQSDLPRWRARLVRDYFSNPWVFLSLVAAVVLLILTFLQTYFAIYAYFRPPS